MPAEELKALAWKSKLDCDVRAQARTASLAEDDLSLFFREVWKVLEPGRELVWSWHYEMICEYLWLIREGLFKQQFGDALGLIINVPPRTAKSTLITVAFPVWCWLKHPERRFMCASYSGALAIEHSVKRRDLILSDWFATHFGARFRLKSDANQKMSFDNDRTGQMIATSVGGTATGKGGDVLIIDDPIDPEQAASDVERTKANTWIDTTVRTRRNNPASDVMIMVMQRLHEMDPTGYVMNQHPGKWVHVKVPLQSTLVADNDGKLHEETHIFPVSGEVLTREVGNVLEPKRFPAHEVKSLQVTRLVWAGQYQQEPAPLEGNMIKVADVMYYGGKDPNTGADDIRLPARFDMVITSVDCAFKDLKTSDYVAIYTVGVRGPDRFVLNLVLDHLDEPATEEITLIEAKRGAYKAAHVLVEDKANGPAVIKALKKKIAGVHAIEPEGGKIARMFVACGAWQSHNWYLPRNASWVAAHIKSLTQFPNNAYDDDVDAMTQVEAWLLSHGYGLFGLWKKQAEEIKAQRSGKSNGKGNGIQHDANTASDHSGGNGNNEAVAALAAAQKKSAGWQSVTESVRERRKLEAQQAADRAGAGHPNACEQCGNPNLAEYGEMIKCNLCGWKKSTDPMNARPRLN
jgi:predicted phage terminase large subunit-like protein